MGRTLGSGIRYLALFGVAGFAAARAQSGAAAFTEAETLRMSGNGANLEQAITEYQEGAKAFHAAGDRPREARALFGLAAAYDSLSRKRLAISAYSQALPIFRAENDRAAEADTLIHLGLDYDYFGDRKRSIDYAAEALSVAAPIQAGAAKAAVLTHAGQIFDRAGQKEKALDFFRQALPLQKDLRNRRGEATVLSGMGAVYYSMGKPREALESLQPALALYLESHDTRDEAFTLTTIGAVYYSTDDYAQALRYFEQAQPQWERCGDRSGESANLHNLASAYERAGDPQKAIAYFNRALSIHRAVNYRIGEANTLTNLGRLHAALGDSSSALAFYSEALPIHRSTANREGEARTFQSIGNVYAGLGDQRKAIENGLAALPLRRAISDRAGEADTLSRLALAYARSGEQGKARELARQSLDLFRETGSPRGQALCLTTLALSHSMSGEVDESIAAYRHAVDLFVSVADQRGEASARYGLAREEARQDRLTEARREIEKVLAIAESLRASVASPELRSYYFASVHDYFDLDVDVLMRLRLTGAAFEASERSRARSLADMLVESQVDIREGADPALLSRERSLSRQLDAVADRHLRELLTQPSGASKTAASLARLTADYRAVESEIRAASPRYTALVEPPPVSAAGIQRGMLDADTVLIEYFLGPERSYVFVVSPNSVEAFALAPRPQIEAAALRFERLLSAGDSAAAAGRSLSALILGPVTARLSGRRLAIVADGALQYVPFAALPWPVASVYQPLLARYEIVSLPSASVLQSLRKEVDARPAPRKTVAILADPVFRPDDPRVTQNGARPHTASAVRGATLNLPRLAGTRQEAETILSLAPATGRSAALDFDANLAAVGDSRLADYRIVHFATHAFLDSGHPELSSIVLSLVDAEGRSKEGVLRLRDIYNLRWNSDLVVLSACRSALGQDVKGEGLVGLTRGFMYAGVPRVVASLWKVDDRQTTTLMRYFYQALLGPRRLSPAAALRAAQQRLRAEAAPLSDWSAFIVTGDWR